SALRDARPARGASSRFTKGPLHSRGNECFPAVFEAWPKPTGNFWVQSHRTHGPHFLDAAGGNAEVLRRLAGADGFRGVPAVDHPEAKPVGEGLIEAKSHDEPRVEGQNRLPSDEHV